MLVLPNCWVTQVRSGQACQARPSLGTSGDFRPARRAQVTTLQYRAVAHQQGDLKLLQVLLEECL